jgi:hypothetical protein
MSASWKCVAAALAAAVLAACAGSDGGARKSSGESIVEVDGAIGGEEGVMPAWLAYALARRIWIDARFFEENPGERVYRFTFDEEVYAREMTAQVSDEQDVPDPYLRQLAAIGRAGFIREYVWACLAQAEWKKPHDLREPEFRAWFDQAMPEHRVETRVSVRREGEQLIVSVGRDAHPPAPCADAAGAR